MKIPVQKHKYSHYSECLQEAVNTYIQLLCEANTGDLTPEQIELLDRAGDKLEYNIHNGEYEKIDCLAKDLHIYNPLHSSEYCLKDGVPDQLYSGCIVIVEDFKLKKFLIIDGNHRTNTLLKYQPEQPVRVILVQGDLSFREF